MAYPVWLVFFLIIPIGLLFLTQHRLLWHYRRTIGMCVLGALIVSVPWDIVAVRSHIWGFQPASNSGITLVKLPVEEYIFIILAAVFISAVSLVLRQQLYPEKRK